MKLSKSILRATRNGASVSLSFLRRTNKGGAQSPSSAARKKRGVGVGAPENPEPSSPKVTCIGQVRVKSKKKSKQQCRSLSRRRTGGEASFRKTEQNSRRRRNNQQRWVHLPISVCEALRSFGAEFSSCLLSPCCCCCCCFRSSCCVSNGERDKSDDVIERGCCRWVVCAGEGGGIEAAVEGETMMCVGSLRRHVFDDLEVRNGRVEVKGQSVEVEEEEEEEGARVSICIPPKNALLLMRCRSDPIKMATLVNRYSSSTTWDSENQENNYDDDDDANIAQLVFEQPEIIAVSVTRDVNDEEPEIDDDDDEEEIESNMSSFEALLDQESGEDHLKVETTSPLSDKQEEATTAEANDVVSVEKEETEELTTHEEEEEEETLLPECLLLMMCEPKLSMEVSKETWVRSTDFIRWLPDRPRKAAAKPAGCEHHQVVKRRPSVDSKPRPPAARKNDHRLQPPRSSCSLPVVTMIERKLQGSAYEPFALTRCKSEPMRTAEAKLLPESCLWKNGGVQVEPPAAGVGF